MAIRKIIESDLSKKSDASTITFGYDDVWYEIDLTDTERSKLEESLKVYLESGRRAQADRVKKPYTPNTTPQERAKIRDWARQNTNLEFADRGRIPKEVMAAYDKAHGIVRN